jgi:CHASE3 domain sensor protein/two-component sensor histidine kinase
MPISQISFVRRTLIAIFVGLAALLVIVAVNLWLAGQTRIYADSVTAARHQRSALVDLRSLLDDAETGQRGYLLTGEAKYLVPYEDARQAIPSQLDRVRSLMAGDPQQSPALAALSDAVPSKLAELKQTIDLYNAGKHDEALAVVDSDRGKKFMDLIRQHLGALVKSADDRLDKAVQDQTASINALRWVTLGGAFVIILVVGGCVWAVILYTRQLVAAQREVQALNAGLEQRVRERTADLGRANEEIQRFAYIVTHDLRAPLVNIMGFTSELDGCLTAIQKYVNEARQTDDDQIVKDARAAALEDLPEAIGFIRGSTRKMDGLINAILKLSREGRRVLKPEPVRLDALLKTAAANVQHQVTEAGGAVEIDAKVPALVSDRLALEQIFGNLLDNAVKYRSPARPLKIEIRAREDRGRRILVEVQDNGRGIARQDHERVFDLFRRSGAQDQPGEGIGLAHVRTMVRNLGGDITLQSDIDGGTTMKLDLPHDLRAVLATQTGGA